MKRILSFFSLTFMAFAVLALSSCSDDDNTKQCYFTLGCEEQHITGSSDELQAVLAYQSQVYEAYIKALGMKSSDNTLIIDGDYSSVSATMRNKFNDAQLPAVPSLAAQYTFKIVLRGIQLDDKSSTELEDMNIVVSKTFSN